MWKKLKKLEELKKLKPYAFTAKFLAKRLLALTSIDHRER